MHQSNPSHRSIHIVKHTQKKHRRHVIKLRPSLFILHTQQLDASTAVSSNTTVVYIEHTYIYDSTSCLMLLTKDQSCSCKRWGDSSCYTATDGSKKKTGTALQATSGFVSAALATCGNPSCRHSKHAYSAETPPPASPRVEVRPWSVPSTYDIYLVHIYAYSKKGEARQATPHPSPPGGGGVPAYCSEYLACMYDMIYQLYFVSYFHFVVYIYIYDVSYFWRACMYIIYTWYKRMVSHAFV